MTENRKKEHRYYDSLEIDEYLDDENELQKRLDEVAPLIGRVIIEFNALEDIVGTKLLEEISPSSLYDEKVAIILGEMMYRAKSEALVRIYRDTIDKIMEEDNKLECLLDKLHNSLQKAATCRNGYAHGSWKDITRTGYVAVRSRSRNAGVIVRYIRYLKPDIEKDIALIKTAIQKLEEFDDLFYEATITMR